MLSLFLTIIGSLYLQVQGSVRGAPDSRTIGLKFGLTAEDYVLLKPNMQPLEESYSVCGWTKKDVTDRGARCWFSYGTSSEDNEISMSSEGFFFSFGKDLDLRKTLADSIDGTWRHQCATWSTSTQMFRVYHEGELVGSDASAANTKLGLDGYVALGNDLDTYGGGFTDGQAFGGILFKANVFNRELKAEEIKEMFLGGVCSNIEEKYGRTAYLKWSDFLLDERSGNVTEVDVGCSSGKSRWDVLYLDSFYNKVLSLELIEKLRNNWDILGKSRDIVKMMLAL